MKLKTIAMAALVLLLSLVFAACGGDDEGSGGTDTASSGGTDTASSGSGGGSRAEIACQAIDSKLADLASGQVSSKGPYGEDPVPASDLELTDAELEKIKGMKATAALVMHFGGNDWTNAQVAGATEQFKKMGIKIVAVTQADGKADKQVSDLETVMARDPDVVLSIPIDPTATKSAYEKVVEQGAKLVFLDTPAKGLKPGEDYVSVVSADNYGNGVAAAHILAKEIGCKGEVGALRYADASNYATEARWQAFQDTMSKDYPDIEIVEDQGINAPDWAGDSERAASAMLTKRPNLAGLFAWFDLPAEGAKQAVTANGTEQPITTVDLGLSVAVEIAKGGLIKGLGAQLPFDQGVAEAMLAGYALLGKKAPPYVVLPPLPVTQDNVLEAWEQVYNSAPPEELAAAANG